MGSSVVAIVMAAGYSMRMRQEKQALLLDGETLLERVIRLLKDSNVQSVGVVVRDPKWQSAIEALGAKYILNELSDMGQSESIKEGLQQMKASHLENGLEAPLGYLFIPCDQPRLTTFEINQLVVAFEAHLEQVPIIVPVVSGKRRGPVIFHKSFEADLLALEGDTGGRSILHRLEAHVVEVPFDHEDVFMDVDTEADVTQLMEQNHRE